MMEELIRTLRSGNHSLVVSNGSTYAFDGRGVGDLHRLLTTNPSMLDGALVADKVVGKGAAALMILGHVRGIYAEIISSPALRLLREASVTVMFGKEVPNIINRRATGICPVETLCLPCASAKECLPLITRFLENLPETT